jgi:hypothetical protein
VRRITTRLQLRFRKRRTQEIVNETYKASDINIITVAYVEVLGGFIFSSVILNNIHDGERNGDKTFDHPLPGARSTTSQPDQDRIIILPQEINM